MATQTITQLMAEVDRIDDDLVALLTQRFAASREIGSIKYATNQPRHDPQRVCQQEARFVAQSDAAGLDPAMARTLITSILSRVLAEREHLFNSEP